MVGKLLVAAVSPYNLIQIDSSISQMLGYETHELLGQSILKLVCSGDESCRFEFMLACQSTEMSVSSGIHFKLCDRWGEELPVLATLSTCVDEAGLSYCQLDIDVSEAISLETACEETHQPKVIISSDGQRTIQHANDEFLAKFNCTLSTILWQSLDLLTGPGPSTWDPLLQAASRGRLARDLAPCSLNSTAVLEDVVCAPVVDEQDGGGSTSS